MVRVGFLVVALLIGSAGAARAQHMVEVRAADTEYRFVDWSYTTARGLVADVFYVGVPGSNELNVGGGVALARGPVVVTPLVYAVVGKEGGQRGVKVAVLVTAERNGWTLSSFLGHYAPVSGDSGAYQVLDTLDVTRALAGGWALGVQAGFFRADGAWNQQVGPLARRADAHGAWTVSYRVGPEREFRVGRVITF